MSHFNDDVWEHIKGFLAWFLPSFFGASAKLAYISKDKKITTQQIITTLIMCCFVGWICDYFCTAFGYEKFRGPIVSLGALGAESLISTYFENVKTWATALINRIFNIKGSEKN